MTKFLDLWPSRFDTDDYLGEDKNAPEELDRFLGTLSLCQVKLLGAEMTAWWVAYKNVFDGDIDRFEQIFMQYKADAENHYGPPMPPLLSGLLELL